MQGTNVLFGQIAVVFGIVIAGVWSATQWTASALGYQLRLGSPWFDFHGTPVYHPWRLFEWWFVFDAYAPHVFDIGGAIAGGSGLVAVLVAIAMSVWRSRQSKLVTTYGSARWATDEEIKSAGLTQAAGLRALDPDDEAGADRSQKQLTRFLVSLRSDMAATSPNRASAVDLVIKVFEFLDGDAISRTFLQYAHGDLLQIMAEGFAQHFANCAQTAQDWPACLATFAGIGQIPLMTVHKSKGLEYDTIAFLGLDDRAWWSYIPGNPEGIATFFVALSRAKQRALFLFCQERGPREKVADLFALLAQAGVQEIII